MIYLNLLLFYHVQYIYNHFITFFIEINHSWQNTYTSTNFRAKNSGCQDFDYYFHNQTIKLFSAIPVITIFF